MAATTVRQFEATYNNGFITGCIDALKTTGEGNIFNTLHDRGLDAVFDQNFITRHGLKRMDPDQLEDFDSSYIYADVTIRAYLKEHERYLMQQIAYFDAEYNPIENYAGIEDETIDRTIGERHITDTENPYERKHTRLTPEIITEQYAENNIVNETEQAQSTNTHKVAPYDQDTFHNESQDTNQPGKVTSTEKPYNRKFKTPQNTITDTEFLTAAKEVERTEDEYTDGTSRRLVKTGNIGIQTAAQMMALDMDFWEKNLWISKMVQEIANLVCLQVEGM